MIHEIFCRPKLEVWAFLGFGYPLLNPTMVYPKFVHFLDDPSSPATIKNLTENSSHLKNSIGKNQQIPRSSPSQKSISTKPVKIEKSTKRTPFPLEYERPNIQVNPPQIFEPRTNATGTKKSKLHKNMVKIPMDLNLGYVFSTVKPLNKKISTFTSTTFAPFDVENVIFEIKF